MESFLKGGIYKQRISGNKENMAHFSIKKPSYLVSVSNYQVVLHYSLTFSWQSFSACHPDISFPLYHCHQPQHLFETVYHYVYFMKT